MDNQRSDNDRKEEYKFVGPFLVAVGDDSSNTEAWDEQDIHRFDQK